MDKHKLATEKQLWSHFAQTWELGYWCKYLADDPNDEDHAAGIWEAFGFERDRFKDLIVLDVGCGPTGRMRYFKDHKGSGKIIGMDPLMDEYRKLKNARLSAYDELIASPAEEFIQELENKFDFVVSLNALDHGYDLQKSLENLYKYMKSDSEALISFDCINEYQEDMTHPLRIRDKEVDALLLKLNFRIIDKTTQQTIPPRDNWGHGIHYHWSLAKR